jgi:heterodisulfide reductase subunit A
MNNDETMRNLSKSTGINTSAPASIRTGVVICDCGDKIAGVIDTQALAEQISQLPDVAYVTHEAYPCSRMGQERMCKVISEKGLNRVLVAGCAPRLIENLFRQSLRSAGLEPGFLHIADIREQAVYAQTTHARQAMEIARDLVEIGLARLATTQSARPHYGRVVKAVLVIGSGLSALTVALSLADSGMHVTMLEEEGQLGGAVPDFQNRTRQLTAEKSKTVLASPMIDVLLNAHLVEVTGHPGDYEVRISHKDGTNTYAFGVIVVSNTAQAKSLSSEQWFDRSRVKTQVEFEAELETSEREKNPMVLNDIVMILCADPSQKEHCSRVCCNLGISQAMRARQLNPDARITVLFRDLYLGGIGEAYENELVQARKQDITFFRYRQEAPPVIGDKTIDVLDTLTGEPVRIPFERVILSMPLVPREHTHTLAALLGLPEDDYGFMAEPRLRLRPGRYADPGIYVLGSAQQPADTAEALFQAYLTSSRAARFLSQEVITLESPIAAIDPVLCTGCGNCPRVCPTQAIHLEKRDGVLSLSEVDELRCIGCGNCVVVCPSKAITLPGWDNVEIPVQISAALQVHPSDSSIPQPRVVALACEWSAYAAADMAGTRRVPYPANVRIIRMNCSARFDPYHILWAFLNGADGVFLGACRPGECHYGTGNLYAKERVEILKKELAQHGVDPRRLHLEFLSVDEGEKFARAMGDFVKEIEEISPVPSWKGI